MRRVNAITFLNNFVAGALTLLIPLLLLAQHVDLAEIGLIVSALPLVFMVARLLFAAVADQIGWSHIFLLANWPATVVATVIYYVANSLSAFFAGKIVEGLRDASYWAVNRTAIFHLSPEREGREATRTNAIIWLATAVGSAAAGLGIALAGFSWTLVMLIIASAAIGIPAAMLWKTGRKSAKTSSKSFWKSLDPRGKGNAFWWASIALMFNSIATYPLLTLLFPVFMQEQLGYSYITIGGLLMLYNVIASVTTFLTLKTSLSFRRALIQSIVAILASVFLAASGLLFPALLFALAFVRGFGVAFFEHLVHKVAKDSENVCVDIGWLHVPMRLAEFATVVSAGFAVQAVGYTPVFAVTGTFYAIFSLMSLQQLGIRR
jgi:predicted MFS family arabinose efflux permease